MKGKNYFNPDVIIKTFKLSLKMSILSKNYDELHIILNNKKHEWNSKCFFKAGEKYMPEVYLWKQKFTHSACGQFTKNKTSLKHNMASGVIQIYLIYL